MAESKEVAPARRPTLSEVELAEAAEKESERRVIAAVLADAAGIPGSSAVRGAADQLLVDRAEAKRLRAARDARRRLTDAETASFGRGPLTIDCDLARQLGWTEGEIELAALRLDDQAASYNASGAARQGRTMVCVRCEQHVKPREPTALPSSGVCETCAQAEVDRAERLTQPAATPAGLEASPAAPTLSALVALVERKRVVVSQLEKMKDAERQALRVALDFHGLDFRGSWWSWRFGPDRAALNAAFDKLLAARRVFADSFREEEIAEARVARAMRLAEELLRKWAKTTPGLSEHRRHEATYLAEALVAAAPEAYAKAPADAVYWSDVFLYLEAVCPEGHAKLLLKGPVSAMVSLADPAGRNTDLLEDQRSHLYCAPAANRGGCGKPLTIRLRLSLEQHRWGAGPGR